MPSSIHQGFTTNQLTTQSVVSAAGSHGPLRRATSCIWHPPRGRALNETNTQGYAWEKEFAETMVSRNRSLKRSIPAFGLALVASLVLGASAVAPASALGAKPENIVPPVVSPTTPHLAVPETTTNGTWTESPTSYSYLWFRCNASGAECVSISGATKSTYTPGEADIGHTLKSRVTATNASGSASAYSNLTNVFQILPEYWYSCQYVGPKGKGPYEDSFCSKEVKEGGTYKLNKLTTSTGFALKGTSSFNVKLNFAGVIFTVSCTTQSAEGTIENPTGGGAGTAAVSKLTLSGCTVTEPKGSGCELVGSAINMSLKGGEATEFEGKPAVKFSPQGGEPLFTFAFEGCTSPGFNGAYSVTGSFIGIANSATSSLEFTKASTGQLLWGGQHAWLEGTSKMETKAGEGLQIAP